MHVEESRRSSIGIGLGNSDSQNSIPALPKELVKQGREMLKIDENPEVSAEIGDFVLPKKFINIQIKAVKQTKKTGRSPKKSSFRLKQIQNVSSTHL